jgi:hypothetical protein
VSGVRCSACGGSGARPPRSGTYSREAKRLVEAATYCYLCGDGPRPGDPLVADHVIPRALGGSDDITNLAPAHRSCNGRKSARLVGLPSSASCPLPQHDAQTPAAGR